MPDWATFFSQTTVNLINMIIGSNIRFYESLQSTNTSASLSLKEKELPEGTVIFTDFQTAGKGQQGKRWESGKGKNLLFSVILYPSSVSPDNQFLISMIISLGICDFISEFVPEVKIKWPNDIYIKNDKIAGILIENSITGETIESCIAGIGININQEKFSPDIPNPVSLRIITGKETDIRKSLGRLLNYLDKRYKQLLYGDRELIREEYASMLYRAGEWHKYRSDRIIFKGRIQGITDSGSLKIEKEDSSVSEFCIQRGGLYSLTLVHPSNFSISFTRVSRNCLTGSDAAILSNGFISASKDNLISECLSGVS